MSKERRLAAIMFTDIAGYTSLSQQNEALALRLLEEHRKVVRLILSKHNGNEIKTMGDAFLAEFDNALDAVVCAHEIQCALHELGTSHVDEPTLTARIGLHVGDVVHHGNDVYGDAVNLASRIEPLADSGGVAMTGQVHDNVRNKTEFPLEYVGQESLKNVEFPVEVYKIVFPWEEAEPKSIVKTLAPRPGRLHKSEVEGRGLPRFVDRESEMRLLSQALEEVVSRGRAKLVFIGGEAGIGKSRLLRAVAEEAESRYGALIAWGYCLEEVSIPYFPFSEAMSQFLMTEAVGGSRRVTNWLDNALKRTFSEGDLGFEQYRLFERMTRLIRKISSERLLLLCLEDMHWSDTASLGLLRYVARNITDSPVLILCSYRSEEVPAIRPGRAHPLVDTMKLMKIEEPLQELELRGLPSEALEDMTGSLIPGLPDDVIELVTRDSEGNPLYAVESARLLAESGLTKGAGDTWRLGKGIQIPSAIQDIISRRLGRLSQDDRQLVECASVLGEHFKPELIAGVLELDALRVIQSMARLERETRLVIEEDAGYRFEHARIKEEVYRGLRKSLASELHRRVAVVLSDLGDTKPVLEIAYHYHAAGSHDKTIEFGLLAGRQATKQASCAEAIKYYDWVLEATEGAKEASETRAEALTGRAEGLLMQGLQLRAIEDSKIALSISKTPSTRLAALRVGSESYLDLGHFSEALEWIERARTEPGEVPLERIRFSMLEGTILSRRGQLDTALRKYQDVSLACAGMGLRKEYAQSKLLMGGIPLGYRNPDVIREALAIFEDLGDLDGQMGAHFDLGIHYFSKGDLELSSSSYQRAIEIAKKLGAFNQVLWAQMYWALTYEAADRNQDALNASASALETATKVESPYPVTTVYSILTRCFLRKNMPEDAEKAFAKMDELYEKHSKDASLGIQGIVARTRGFRSAWAGEWMEADLAYATAIDLLARFMKIHEVEARKDYGEWLTKQGRWGEARKQLEKAIDIYKKLGNEAGVEATNALMHALSQK